MSEFLKNNPILQIILLITLMLVFFFTITKPAITKGDDAVYKKVEVELTQKIDTVNINLVEILETIKK